MENTFTAKQVMLCEVQYTLDDFWRDLVDTVVKEYPLADEQKWLFCQRFVYQVLYAAFNENIPTEIDVYLGIPDGLAESILEHHRDDFEMLKSVIMGMFLRNLQNANGILSDQQNLRLLNAQLRNFHEKNNL